MKEHIEQFLVHMNSERRLTGNTIAAYRTDLEQFVTYVLEHAGMECNPKHMQEDDILGFINFLRSRDYANSTIARRTAAIKSFFGFMAKSGLITRDPTETIESPKVERVLPYAVTMAEIDNLLELPLQSLTPEGLRDKAMLELLYATGLRVSELVGLNVDDVNMEEETVSCVGRGKRQRLLPLGHTAITALEEYLDLGRTQLIRNNSRDEFTEALFLNHRGRRLTRQGFWLILRSYAKQLGLHHLTPHTLRHSFAAHMINNGVELRKVQELLGHASPSTTQIYRTMIKKNEGQDQPTAPENNSRLPRISSSRGEDSEKLKSENKKPSSRKRKAVAVTGLKGK